MRAPIHRSRGPLFDEARPENARHGARTGTGFSLASMAWGTACMIILLLIASASGSTSDDTLASASIIATPPMARPGYLQPATDPVFGTQFMRVTDPGRVLAPRISCGAAYCRHRYSSTQAWNADQSLFAIFNGCEGICFLDGRTYQPAFDRSNADDCNWSPTDPALMICVHANQLYTWAPRTNANTVVFAPSEYSKLEFGPNKGNPSSDGRLVVLRATNRSGRQTAFAYDIAARKKYPDINLGNLPGKNGYCGISPSGRYIVCFQTLDSGTEVVHVFTVSGEPIQKWPEHHRPGHGDMATDADGNDVYIGISKADPDKWHVIKRRLQDGVVTDLAPAGHAEHASLRSIKRPGWVFLSYEASYPKVFGEPGRTPFYQEVVALRIDGSGEIRRIAQTRDIRVDYYSETHASPSPDASQVVWSSNWGEAGGPVADYVSQLQWPGLAMK